MQRFIAWLCYTTPDAHCPAEVAWRDGPIFVAIGAGALFLGVIVATVYERRAKR